jgi:hypothetical protein
MKLELYGCIDMNTGNKRGQWLMPFNWKQRREKELAEVKTIYKELQRREDLINQYYLKSSILKGEVKVKDLDEYLYEKHKQKNTRDIIIFKEKPDENEEDREERKLPKMTKEFRQTILMNPLYKANKNKQEMDKLFEREEVPDDQPSKNDIPKEIEEIMFPKVIYFVILVIGST